MIDLKIIPDEGEPYDLHIGSRVIMHWERTTKGSFKRLTEGLSMTDLYNLAHRAAIRQGSFSGSLTEFEENHDLEQLGEPEGQDDGSGEADPTRAGASSAE